MNRGMRLSIVLALLWVCLCACSAKPMEWHPAEETSPAATPTQEPAPPEAPKLYNMHVTGQVFMDSLKEKRDYNLGPGLKAAVIPHHLTAASLISGFFASAARDNEYDTIIVIAPNHDGDIADIILSDRDWQADGVIPCDKELASQIAHMELADATIETHHARMEEDHSASVMMPYIHYYFPDAQVCPVLLSRTLTLDGVLGFADQLNEVIENSGRRVLLLASVDFSHYLTPREAYKRDEETLEAIERFDYPGIHGLPNEHLDSPASLIVFLKYAESNGLNTGVADHGDASQFASIEAAETTSYFVLSAGC